jgi:hypothetical protein
MLSQKRSIVVAHLAGLAVLLVAACLPALIVVGMEGPFGKSEMDVWAQEAIQELYGVTFDPQESYVIGQGEIEAWIDEFTTQENSEAMDEMVELLRVGLEQGSVVGLLIPEILQTSCARTRDVIFVAIPVSMRHPDFPGIGGVILADFCRESAEEKTCRNCGGCEGEVDGSARFCVCTISKKCRECPPCPASGSKAEMDAWAQRAIKELFEVTYDPQISYVVDQGEVEAWIAEFAPPEDSTAMEELVELLRPGFEFGDMVGLLIPDVLQTGDISTRDVIYIHIPEVRRHPDFPGIGGVVLRPSPREQAGSCKFCVTICHNNLCRCVCVDSTPPACASDCN